MKAQERFNEIKPRYISAYKKNNHTKPSKIWFENGWVYLQTSASNITSKYRVSQLEQMTKTLESRLTNKS